MTRDLQALGYDTFRADNMTLIHRSSMPDLRSLADGNGPLGEPSSLSGRSPLRIIQPDLVVRTLMHGGLFRHITGRNFLSPERTLQELAISSYLSSKGIPTPEILAVRIRQRSVFCHIEVISRLIPDSTDLLTYLEETHADSAELLMKAGRVIRSLHDLGVYHADLHIKNLLLDHSKALWVLDLDKAYHFETLNRFFRQRNLKRFIRSLRKWLGKGRIQLPGDWESSLMKGYGTAS